MEEMYYNDQFDFNEPQPLNSKENAEDVNSVVY